MNTKRYAVIGDPVSQSLSPLLHQGWIADHGLDATYEAVLLRSEDPVRAIRGLTRFAGLNVTAPHKAAAAKAADRSEDGVANVLRWEADGTLSAFNTDGAGFVEAVEESVPQWRARTKAVLIIGAGGAARAITKALAGSPSLIVVNRTHARAAALVEQLPAATARSWEELPALFAAADLIVNATTLGMSGSPSPEWPVQCCKRDAIIADIVYRPLKTALLASARAEGLTTIDGLGMLIHQGARAFEIWHDAKPDTKIARRRLMAALAL